MRSRAIRSRMISAGVMVFLAAAIVEADETRWQVGQAADWVVPEEIPGSMGSGGGVEYLLYDRQVNVGTTERFRHVAYRVNNQSGVQSASSISVGFIPAYETVILNDIRVIRDGVAQDRLDSAYVDYQLNDERTDGYIVDDSASLDVHMEDVRVGDVIEYAITISGANPAFGANFFVREHVQFSVPVSSVSLRVVVPRGRKTTVEVLGSELKPDVVAGSDATEYRWDFGEVQAVAFEDNVPVWYDPFAMLHVSDFASWDELESWIDPLFEEPDALSDDLDSAIAQIESSTTSMDDRISQTIAFVQNEIRYLGIEIGVGSYVPTDPSVVFARRYGDCKDKALLLCTMLRRLGVDSHPALVDSSRSSTFDWFSPSPLDFDHVIVRIDREDQSLWVDPTASFQGGVLGSQTLPIYQNAIVIGDPSTTGPVQAGSHESSRGWLEVSERYIATSYTQESTMRARFVYGGRNADLMRADYATGGSEAIAKDLLSYFHRLYPQAKMINVLQVSDHTAENRMEVELPLGISDLWTLEDGDRQVSTFEPVIVYDILSVPEVVERRMPYALVYPFTLDHTIEIVLPESVSFEETVETIANDFFTFRKEIAYGADERHAILTYRLETLRDSVPPERTLEYIKQVDRVFDQMATTVSFPVVADGSESTNGDAQPSFGPTVVSLLMIFTALFVRMISVY